MPNIFLIADTHFGQKNAIKFFREDGVTPLRPFKTVEEMDEFMIEAWNKTVGPKDKVYHLGDVVFQRRNLPILARLNGDKVLIRGNHDHFKLSEYQSYFRDVRATHSLDNYILSHIPLHPDSLKRWMGGNIHGHLHDRQIKDSRYLCVSVEQIDYSPIEFGEARERIKEALLKMS